MCFADKRRYEPMNHHPRAIESKYTNQNKKNNDNQNSCDQHRIFFGKHRVVI